MKKITVTVPWDQGLHMRPAAKLVHLAQKYRSAIRIRSQDKIADAGSIINIMPLYAAFGTLLEDEISGDDETVALVEIEHLFDGGDADTV